MVPPRKTGSLDFYGMIQKGENPNGMMAQTADSTVRNADALGPQEWPWNMNADGDRWNGWFKEKMQAVAVPATTSRRRR